MSWRSSRRADQAKDRLRATYIEIEQVPHTHAVVLSKPYWIWGAEMGVNEHGVAIGNEAVFTKAKREKQSGLLGMDLLRLALERAETADEAVGGHHRAARPSTGSTVRPGHTHKLRLRQQLHRQRPPGGWILETVGRDWAAQRVDATASICNGLTLGVAERASPGLRESKVTDAPTSSSPGSPIPPPGNAGPRTR